MTFLDLLDEISQLEKYPKMTPISKLILDQIALFEHAEKSLTVRELIGCEQIASPATLHKHLSSLRKLGYVSAASKNTDKRTKHLTLSTLGNNYINNLSKAIVQAGRSK